MLTVFWCNDMEEAWIASICARGELEMLEWERQEDLDHEEELGIECVYNEDLTDWPVYADDPFVIQDPEIFDDVTCFYGQLQCVEDDN